MAANSPVVLMILDGWGYSEQQKYNAIAKANTPQWDEWWLNCPHILLDASGVSVGLPNAQMGNSEVGHMHIGAGRVVQQDFTRINDTITQGKLTANPVLDELTQYLINSKKALHLMGLLSPGGVHSHEEHLFALLGLCHQKQINKVYLHLFLDGRDTPPQSVLASIARLDQLIKNYSLGRISSITGRYYAMDRDQRWERVEPVYQLLTEGQAAHHFTNAQEAISFFYQQNLSDEFIPPCKIGSCPAIQEDDAVLFFNFRADRARQLTAAFIDPNFSGFYRKVRPKLAYFATMTEYDKNLPTTVLFPPSAMNNTLGEVLAKHGLRQLRIAETEKYAHVTFFFNGGKEQLFLNEQRTLIPSPKVATYDLQPEMSAPQLTDTLVQAIQDKAYDVIICNYANADMVGHSGNIEAAIKAVECLDHCMSRVWQALKPLQGKLLITSDHGNAEEMFDEHTHQAHTAHTSEPVPFLYVGGGWHFNTQQGNLTDIAPTLLHLLGITPPTEMTGHILLEENNG
ncbi:2,3-bisphosphoglycerate-independent phosphoglycerate mutase [Legionella sp. km772]|uniref:2,3-bisphosphoglycerate-independent phosphoglycerate mutase n=1 Tax=Legionella sp. km772 TaxID=2498111 RepID=UPI000F8CD81F|nr:2,3-bisphosphoglycerate-independent phosphoglycerate mutase [Legionella sp. km772]RUR13644.1 2,3-bisphosphoglycerate-independent phosphoglycerate mutase [Legionella sp. km772]